MKNRQRMFVLFLVVSCGATLEHNACAQQIYVLLAGDMDDPEIGQSDQIDLNRMERAFAVHVPSEQLVFYSEYSKWSGPAIETAPNPRKAVLNAIANCPAGHSDTIVAYWSGHGAYDSGGHYLVMPNRTALYRKDVLDAFRRKGPRLAVLISDACNTRFDSSGLPGVEPAFEPPLEISPLFEELFLNHQGLVDINASSEAEEAVALKEFGGLFTAAIASLENDRDEDGEPTGRGIEVEARTRFSSRKVRVPVGFVWTHGDERRDWNDLISYVNRNIGAECQGLTHQAVRVWSLPTRSPRNNKPRPGPIPPILSLTRGDVILTINSRPIAGEDDCNRAVRNSVGTMEFTIRDSRDGTVWRMQTTLRRRSPRFGAYLDDQPGGGALVTGVVWGSPCTRNKVLERVKGGAAPEVVGPLGKVHPEVGDVIVEVNGQPVRTRQECVDAVNRSPNVVEFVTRGKRTGRLFTYRSRLRSSGTRLGVGLADTGGKGARITYLKEGYPCMECELVP